MASTITSNLNKIKKATNSSLSGLAQLMDYNFAQIVTGLQSFLGPDGITYDATNNAMALTSITAGIANITSQLNVGPLSGALLFITADGKLTGQAVSAPVVNTTRLRFTDFNTVSNIGTPGIVGELVYVGVNNTYDEGMYAYLQTTGWTKLTGSGGGGGGSTTLAGLTDVNLINVQDGQVLYFDQTMGKWTNSTANLIAIINGFSSLTNPRIPYWNGTGFVNSIITQPNPTTINVAGDFSATTKSFLIDHPSKKGWKLRYGNLEGPEHAVYVRGMNKGRKIKLPKHWKDLVDFETITVNVSPIGEFMPLYVESISEAEITVIGATGFYYYTIFAERKDVDKLIVEFKK